MIIATIRSNGIDLVEEIVERLVEYASTSIESGDHIVFCCLKCFERWCGHEP